MPLIKDNKYFNRNHFTSYLEINKIQTRPYFTGNLLYHPAYKRLNNKYNIAEFPNANVATRNSIMLGTYIGITDTKIKKIEGVVEQFFKEVL